MERSQATGGSTVLLEEQKQQPEIVTFTVKPKKGGIKWTEDTIDNEHMNKKKSKICCQYNKPSEHGCCSDSDSSDDEHDERNTYDRPPKHMRKAEKQQKQSEGHEHGHECQH
ncbi:hypothetical protein FGO68_gene4678 [Halteria grandinella]|uniref:Protein phosphatase 1 regulatory subunit 11 n=1 Tax=Halteria grandinella TaxID=5974 RepID=A0A8J8NHG7_HALGN|nr:hypothetical protein FGO68_gene4678 [Halteria grandinella]